MDGETVVEGHSPICKYSNFNPFVAALPRVRSVWRRFIG
ncbi:hypothetical protein SAMN05216554_4626 [Herbiconiux ginsengi]|uniref:Uncharacterized protein n=1 Tax=Herbiconiux ginsengi TaxID=381665 RepID=A0A1H3U1F1_9MICO|nr:hypothetical protein SAMN05216554_4626 [Herbiconiux ginsengi]